MSPASGLGHKHAGSASQFSLRVCAPYLGVRRMLSEIRNLKTEELLGIAKASLKASLVFFLIVFVIVATFKIGLDWANGMSVRKYFTAEVALATIRQPLLHYAIFQMFVIYFAIGLTNAVKRKRQDPYA